MTELVSLHSILTAWQAGEIDYRQALELADIDTLDELYEAADLSNVPIRTRTKPIEGAQAEIVADVIRANPGSLRQTTTAATAVDGLASDGADANAVDDDLDAFEADVANPDERAANDHLNAGRAIYISEDDTPYMHVVEIAPSGKRTLFQVSPTGELTPVDAFD